MLLVEYYFQPFKHIICLEGPLSWNFPKLSFPRTSFSGTTRHYTSFQKKEAIKSPPQL